MKYLLDINNNHYEVELNKGETKRIEYTKGHFAEVTALTITKEPTPTSTGTGFIHVVFDNGNVWDSKIATIGKTMAS